MKEIYFAGGCFWGTQHYLKKIRGVVGTLVGYANGETENPTYKQVYTDTTGYAETVKVLYDPAVVSLPMLVELYFHSVDPTLLNRQGGDVGTRYRTGIYYTSPEELSVIQAVYDKVALKYENPLVVELEPLRNFYPAEEYHQNYLDTTPEGYCHISVELMEFASKANREE